MTDQLTEEEEKTKSLNKLKNKQEAVIADLEGNCLIPGITCKHRCVFYMAEEFLHRKSVNKLCNLVSCRAPEA